MTINTITKTRKSAFSLIELSIVLAIISVIISGAVTASTSALKNAKAKSTKDKMAVIQKALNVFVYTYKRLPCPASLHDITTDSTYGAEAGSAGDCTATGVLTSTNSNANEGLVYGAVPVKALGLNLEYLGDGFDNKFSYVVPKQLTEVFASGGASGFEGTNMDATSSVDPITIQETISGQPGSSITTVATYALISHGSNGYRAFNINSGSTQNGSSSDTDEENNAPTGVSGGDIFDNVFVVNSGGSDFDDLIAYNTRETLVQEIGGFNITVCPEETSSYNDSCSGEEIEFPAAYYGETTQGNIDCSEYGCYSDNPDNFLYPRRKCGLNGQWEPVEYECY